MKLQLNVLLNVIKKTLVWLVILLIIVILSLVLFQIDFEKDLEAFKYFSEIICFPFFENVSVSSKLISLYQIGFTIYFTYLYYSYEFTYAKENILLRIKDKKWLLNKLIVGSTLIALMRSIFNILIYLFFKDYVVFNINYIFVPVLCHEIFFILIITFKNTLSNKESLIFLLSIISSAFVYAKYNLVMGLLILFVLLLFNIIIFKFKKIMK